MARTIQQIQAQMVAQQATQPDLAGLNSPSQTAIYTLWQFLVSYCIWIHETLWDLFKADLEQTISNAPVGTDNWVQQKAFEFQYSSTVPQVVYINTNTSVSNPPPFVPTYTLVDPTLQIITRASVKTLPNRIVSVKVAKENPPVALNGSELNSFQGYLDIISFAGVQFQTQSSEADKILLDANIFYNGQYNSTISADTINSINNYLSTIPFDGYLRLSSLETAILNTSGVTDVVFNNVAIRPDVTPFSAITSLNYLVQGSTELTNKSNLYAGYVVEENTPAQTFADKLNFIIE